MSLSLTATQFSTTTILAIGHATYIADHLQQEVLMNRLNYHQVEFEQRAIGYGALRTCDLLGELVIISWPTGSSPEYPRGNAGPYQVIDCGSATDQEYLQDIEFAVEVAESQWRARANVGQPGGAWVSVYLAEESGQKQPALPPVMRGMDEPKALAPTQTVP